MNSDILGGKWNELKGKIKETFGKLTDDDMLQLQGSNDRIVGVLQERYGYGKEQAQQEWENFARQHVTTAADTYEEMKDTAKAAANDASSGVVKLAKDIADKVTTAVKR